MTIANVNFSLNKLAQDVKSAIRGEKAQASIKLALFLGAGASYSSGIILTSQMIEHFKELVYKKYEITFANDDEEKIWLSEQKWFQKESSDYSKFFEECYDTETKRRSYIESIVEGSEPSFGYMVLANLIHQGYFKTVITTNFDDLVYMACTTFTQTRPVVYSLGGFATEMSLSNDRPRILKLHGDFLYSSLKNTGNEIKNQDENMQKEVQKVLEEYDGLIIAGYSGNDRSVVEMLEKLPKGKTLYWCYQKDSPPPIAIQAFCNENGRYLVEVEGFDELMNKIRQTINISNKDLAFNFRRALQKATDMLFQYEDNSTTGFLEEIANQYRNLTMFSYAKKAFNEKDYIRCEQINREILELFTFDYIAYDNLGLAISKDKKRLDEAEVFFREAIRLNPKPFSPLNNLGTILSEQPKRRNEAEIYYKNSITLNPYFAKSYYNLGILLIEDKTRSSEAKKLFEKTIELNPDHYEATNNLGSLYFEESDIQQAKLLFKKALEIKPDYAEAHNNLGNVYFRHEKNYDEAEKEYLISINLAPDYPIPYVNLARLYMEIKQEFSEAKRLLRKAIEFKSDSSDAYNALGVLFHVYLHKLSEAERIFREAINWNDRSAANYEGLGSVLYEQNKLNDALDAYLKAIELNDRNGASFITIASIYRALDDNKNLQIYAIQAKKLIKNDEYYNLACLHSVLNQKNQAFEYLEKAFTKEPEERNLAKRDPDLKWLSSDPRFNALLNKVT